MKRGTILHPALSRVVASLGHGDALVIAEAGLPIPPEVERIDLAFARLTRWARAVVRTGEFTPHANVVLLAGVVF